MGTVVSESSTVCRLSEATRELARRARAGEWGRGLVNPPILLEPGEIDGLSGPMQVALGVRRIAEQAPLRIVAGEKLVGAATLERATWHVLPVGVRDRDTIYWSTSHTTIDFERGLREGYAGIRRRIDERVARGGLDEKGRDFLNALRICLDAAAIWHGRYVEALERLIAESDGPQQSEYRQLLDTLRAVPEQPPRDFRQAVQALWMLFDFQRLCGNWSGLGRIDKMLGPYLSADLASGKLTLDDARELLAHFWIKGCEWVGAPRYLQGTGDAQYYQNVILGGIDEDGNDVTNEVTYLVLDIVEELRINEYPIAVRIAPDSPPRLLRRIAEVQRLGGGIVAIYNERQIIDSLVAFGYPLREARNFTNDGCWEVLIPGRTKFGYLPFDVLAVLQQTLGVTGDAPPAEFPDFESLYAAFRQRLADRIADVHRLADGTINGGPATLVSLLVDDCIERARGYNDGGPRYTVAAPHAGGLPDAANSLLALRRLVYEQRRLSLPQLVAILRADWAGHEPLRREVASWKYYGNDDLSADELARRVFDDFLTETARVKERCGVLRPPGVSTFGREIEWRPHRGATAAGSRAGDTLATNFSPSPGTDRSGPTAVLSSIGRMGLQRLTNGTAVELKMHPSAVAGEAGLRAMEAILRTFLALGGIYLQIDVVDNAVLRDAQEHPENHQSLAVRVSGWSARFVTLAKEWQDMIIRRTEQK